MGVGQEEGVCGRSPEMAELPPGETDTLSGGLPGAGCCLMLGRAA